MADKRTKLEIVIGAIDKATAVVRSIQRKIDAIAVLAAPISLIGERLGGLAKAAGLPKLVEGLGGVGGAVTGVLGKLAAVGGVIAGAAAGAVAGLFKLIDGFDDLGDKAEHAGVGVDFLAQLRFAAQKSGASVEALDAGILNLSNGLGLARANTGGLYSFLKTVSPVLLRQVKAAKSNEAAFRLLADAMIKLKDPAKRAAFAQKTLGDASLAPLLAKGGKGIDELRDRYAELAPGQAAAAAAAGEVGDAMDDLKATTDGIKAALVTGLAPALKLIVEQLSAWFQGNRARIAEFAASLGKRIPDAVKKLVGVFTGIVETVRPFIDSTTKLKIIAVAVAAVIAGPLVASVYSLGVALLTTPVGWILAGLAAIAAAGYLLITRWDAVKAFFVSVWDTLGEKFGWARTVISFALAPIIGFPLALVSAWATLKEFFASLWDSITGVFERAWGSISSIVDKVTGAVSTMTGAIGDALDFINPFSDGGGGPQWNPVGDVVAKSRAAMAAQQQSSSARVTVDFANAPKGTRVAADPQSTASVDLSVGYQMGMMP